MDNNYGILIAKKMIQKELLNELCNKGLIEFENVSRIIKKLDEDISKLKKLQDNSKEIENIVIEIPV